MSGTRENEYRWMVSGSLEDCRELKAKSVGEVFGDDMRERVSDVNVLPYSAVWRLRIIVNGIPYRGTGYMVKPGVMLTAGHNIYDHDTKRFADKVYAIGRDGRCHELYDVIIPEEYKKSDVDVYDWAVARVSVVPGEIYPVIELINMDDGEAPDVVNKTAEIAGFPAEVRGVTTYDMYREEGMVAAYDRSSKTLNYQIDTSGGNSGSPVIVYKDTIPYAIGIHVSSGGNCNVARAVDNRIADAVNRLNSKDREYFTCRRKERLI